MLGGTTDTRPSTRTLPAWAWGPAGDADILEPPTDP